MAMRKYPRLYPLPLAVLALLGASGPVPAQSPAPTAQTASGQPVISDDTLDDFAELSRNLVMLQSKIAKAKRIIAESQDPDLPANQREAFGHTLSSLLDAFAEGGQVNQFEQSAVDFVHQRLEEAEHDANFPPEQKEALIVRWRRLASQTEVVAASLDTTRRELSDKLKLLRTKADFVDQMEKLRQARAVLDALGDLADQRQAVSERLRDLLKGRTNDAPGM
jgi:hypothetical protein